MGNKVTISNFATPESSSFITKLNNDFDTVEAEFDKVIYQDGSVAMEGDLDFGSNRLYNLPFPMTPTEPIRVQDVAEFIPYGPKGDPGSPGEGYSTRVEMANAAPTDLDDAFLTEMGREGKFIFDASDMSDEVSADPAQGLYIPLAVDPTGASGAWVRAFEGGLRPEWFGAKGDGFTDDSLALYRTSVIINLLDGGTIELAPAAVYMVGGQTMQNPPLYTYYTFPPNVVYPILFDACTKPVILKGNGATIRCLPNAKYGVFNTDGSDMSVSSGYVGIGAATPYYYMIKVLNCKAVTIENVILDGNLPNTNVNGHFGDVGIQIAYSGIDLENVEGPTKITNVQSFHHGLDGIQINGPCDNDNDPFEQGHVTSSRFEMNGRQGMSIVGGKGWTFTRCSFNWTGKLARNNDAVVFASPPGAGIDFEAEGGKKIRDIHLQDCEVLGNYGAGVLFVGDVKRITASNSRIIGTTNYSIWADGLGFKMDNCLIAGTVVYPSGGGTAGDESPYEAFHLERCDLTNDNAVSPTGTTFVVNNLIIEGGIKYAYLRKCRLIHNRPGAAANGNADGITFDTCEFKALQGDMKVFGRFVGENLFDNTASVPGGSASIVGYDDAGKSYNGWLYRTLGNVTTRYPATVDDVGNKLTTLLTGIDADYTLNPGIDNGTFYLVGPQTASRVFTLSNATAFTGAKFKLIRTTDASGAFDIVIKAGAGGPTIFNLSAGEWVTVEYISAALGWKVTGSGPL